MLAVIADSGFIAPVDLSAFLLGTLGDLRILLFDPAPHSLGILLVVTSGRALSSKAPTLQTLPAGSLGKPYPVTLLNQIADCSACPQREWHLELVRGLVGNHVLNFPLLNRCQIPAAAFLPSPLGGTQCTRPLIFIICDPASDGVVMNVQEGRRLPPIETFFPKRDRS